MKLNKTQCTIFVSLIIILIGQLSNIVGGNAVLIFSIIITGIYSLICPKDQLLNLTLLLIASNRVLTIGGISAPTVVMMMGVFRLLLNNNLKLRKSMVVAIIILYAFSFITYLNGYSQLLQTTKILIVILFIRNYMGCFSINDMYSNCLEMCTIGCIITCILSILINPSTFYGNTRFSLTDGGGENVLGILCSMNAINLIICILNSKKINKIKYYIYTIFLIIICFITGSRSAIAILGISVFLLIIITSFNLRIKTLVKLLICLLLLIVFFLLLYINNDVFSTFIDSLIYRSQKLANVDISNGRFELWIQYINIFKNNIRFVLFGGLNYYSYGIELVAHNMIIEQIAAYGILGSIVLIYLYLDTFREMKLKFKGNSKMNYIQIIPLTVFIMISMVSHSLLGVPQTMILYICSLCILSRY